jgi:hypothetical protein
LQIPVFSASLGAQPRTSSSYTPTYRVPGYSGHIPKIAAENKFGGTYGMMCDGDDEVRIRQHRNDFPIFHYTQMS